LDTVYHLEAALKARTLFHKEKDYIVKDNEVILVDEFTGRLMVGRRLSEGLQSGNWGQRKCANSTGIKNLGTVSLQNYFRMYERLAGMTGTAVTEAEEFHKIYKLDVVVIPTPGRWLGEDKSDAILQDCSGKIYSGGNRNWKSARQRTAGFSRYDFDLKRTKFVSELLKRKGIKHEVPKR